MSSQKDVCTKKEKSEGTSDLTLAYILYMSHDYQSQRELTAMFTSFEALFVISR